MQKKFMLGIVSLFLPLTLVTANFQPAHDNTDYRLLAELQIISTHVQDISTHIENSKQINSVIQELQASNEALTNKLEDQAKTIAKLSRYIKALTDIFPNLARTHPAIDQ